jgi:hypothetical protein
LCDRFRADVLGVHGGSHVGVDEPGVHRDHQGSRLAQLRGYLFSEQSVLTAIDAHDQGRAVCFDFQPCLVGGTICSAEIAVGAGKPGSRVFGLHS